MRQGLSSDPAISEAADGQESSTGWSWPVHRWGWCRSHTWRQLPSHAGRAGHFDAPGGGASRPQGFTASRTHSLRDQTGPNDEDVVSARVDNPFEALRHFCVRSDNSPALSGPQGRVEKPGSLRYGRENRSIERHHAPRWGRMGSRPWEVIFPPRRGRCGHPKTDSSGRLNVVAAVSVLVSCWVSTGVAKLSPQQRNGRNKRTSRKLRNA